jgi:hypothetical protein
MFPRSVLIDARGAWPPLVRRGVMMDLESYDAWGRRGAELLTREGVAVKRWLAACLFACWIACQGDGLASIVEYLQNCYRVFGVELARDGHALEAIRRANLRVMHT